MKLRKGDNIVTAYAQRASDSDWVNQPVWVIIRDHSGNLREEYISTADQGHRTHTLRHVAAALHSSLVAAIYLDMEADDDA